ncbi:hypothetical protein [uncultured Tateyamaria sp.]|uniref:hypothetical protein n=1 Tax=Tateyamaria sp. 1078 TaxID=3417464 RepID=UPI00260654B1|nr:hypothetical protein [uncultured Tateyamaria sp.]
MRGCARVAAIVDEECTEIAVNNSADVLKRNLYNVRGFSSATGTYMMRSGFGWGTLNEIRVVAVLLELGHAANRLRLSMPMPDGALGPDIMVYRGLKSLGHGISKRLFSVVQCKALKDFGTMVSPGSSSESLRQLCGDTRRMGAEVPLQGDDVRPPWHGPTRNEGGDGVGALFDGGYSFAFDFWHFIRHGDSPFVTIGNQARNLPGRADEVFPGALTGLQLINRAKELMREVLNHRATVLQDTINILRTHPAPDEVVEYSNEIGEQLMHAINNQVLRKHEGDKTVRRLPMADLTPDTLKDLNIISQAQRDVLETLLPPTSAAYRIAAARMALELSDQALETMPKFSVSMGIVEEGGSWINQGIAFLASLRPGGGS